MGYTGPARIGVPVERRMWTNVQSFSNVPSMRTKRALVSPFTACVYFTDRRNALDTSSLRVLRYAAPPNTAATLITVNAKVTRAYAGRGTEGYGGNPATCERKRPDDITNQNYTMDGFCGTVDYVRCVAGYYGVTSPRVDVLGACWTGRWLHGVRVDTCRTCA